MPIRPAETYELVEEACSFPAHRDTVVERVGATELLSAGGETVALETLLARSQPTHYESARELHNTVMSNLGADFIGREGYDDRGSNPARETSVSF